MLGPGHQSFAKTIQHHMRNCCMLGNFQLSLRDSHFIRERELPWLFHLSQPNISRPCYCGDNLSFILLGMGMSHQFRTFRNHTNGFPDLASRHNGPIIPFKYWSKVYGNRHDHSFSGSHTHSVPILSDQDGRLHRSWNLQLAPDFRNGNTLRHPQKLQAVPRKHKHHLLVFIRTNDRGIRRKRSCFMGLHSGNKITTGRPKQRDHFPHQIEKDPHNTDNRGNAPNPNNNTSRAIHGMTETSMACSIFSFCPLCRY